MPSSEVSSKVSSVTSDKPMATSPSKVIVGERSGVEESSDMQARAGVEQPPVKPPAAQQSAIEQSPAEMRVTSSFFFG